METFEREHTQGEKGEMVILQEPERKDGHIAMDRCSSG